MHDSFRIFEKLKLHSSVAYRNKNFTTEMQFKHRNRVHTVSDTRGFGQTVTITDSQTLITQRVRNRNENLVAFSPAVRGRLAARANPGMFFARAGV
jgi:hypothetical protein